MEQHREALGARALEKALDLLFSFQPDSPEQSLFQISHRLRFPPPSTTRRLLKAMMSRRLVQQDSITKLYRLGPEVLSRIRRQRRSGHKKNRPPVMERLRDVTGENTTLHELRMASGCASRRSRARQVLRDTVLIGEGSLPGHCGASGKGIARLSSRRGDQGVY